jgi:methionine synthase II (cobalamin-independent)
VNARQSHRSQAIRLAGVIATGIGSLPGEDIDRAIGTVFTELPDLPHLPELPSRGPGADMIGRAAAALADLHIDLQPSGWRLVPRAGMDERRAESLLERDLDALVPVAAEHDGPLKIQLAGPWTLAASLQTTRGPVLADAGAVRDLLSSYVESAVQHVAAVRRRTPQAKLLLQLDEPSLPAVLAGVLPTASGLGAIAAVDEQAVERPIREVVAAVDVPVTVHCCASRVPHEVLGATNVAAISIDLLAGQPDRDALATLVDQGRSLWLGVVSGLGPGVPPRPRDVADPVRRLWGELGFSPQLLTERVVLTPSCGLAGASEGWARTAMQLVRQAAKILAEAPEGMSA